MLRSRMGSVALLLMLLCSVLFTTIANATKAYASIPTSGSGPTATFIDAAHIALNAQGTTVKDSNGIMVDLSPISGVYFDNLVLADQQDWTLANRLGQGANPMFYFNSASNTQPTCQNSSQTEYSTIKLESINGGTVNLKLDAWVPEADSDNPTRCGEYISYFSAVNNSLGYSFNSFNIVKKTQIGGHGGGASSETYQPLNNLNGESSNVLFFMSDSTDIVEAGADSDYGGNSSANYQFSYVNATGHFAQQGYYNPACPDYIVAPKITATSPLVVKATYYARSFGPNNATCESAANAQKFTVLVFTQDPSTYSSQLTGVSPTSSTVEDDCPISEWGLRWLACPIVVAIDGMVSPIDKILNKWLVTPNSDFDASKSPGSAYYAAWGDFRDIAVSLLIIAALVMVIGQSAGFDLLDAYSIRKVLPRLLIAAVALTLSWPLMGFVVEFFNNIGNWIGDIILFPFQGLYPNAQALSPAGLIATITGVAVDGVIGIGVIATAVIALGPLAIIALVLSLVLALFVAFVTLTIREMIIILGVITAPVAIVMYILPTTQRVWKFWRDAVISALVMFPIISAFIAVGRVMAILFAVQGGVTVLLAPVAIIVSYFMIGTAFRLAGGLVAAASGMVQNFHGGAFKGLKSFRRNELGKNWDAMKNQKRYQGKSGISQRANRFTSAIAAQREIGFTMNPKRRMQATKDFMATDAERAAEEAKEKDPLVKALHKNDGLMRPVMSTIGGNDKGAVQRALAQEGNFGAFIDERSGNMVVTDQEELDQRTEQVMSFQRRTGNGQVTEIIAASSLLGAGTGFKNTELAFDARAPHQAVDAATGATINLRELQKDPNQYNPETDGYSIVDRERTVNTTVANQNNLLAGLVENQDYTYNPDRSEVTIKRKMVEVHDAAAKAWESVAVASHGENSIRDNMIGAGKGVLTQTGRPEIGSAGYGYTINETEKLAKEIVNNPNASPTARAKTRVRVTQSITADATKGTSAQQVFFTGREYAAEQGARGYRKKLLDAVDSLNAAQTQQDREKAQDQVDIMLAQVQSVREAQGSMPQASGNAIQRELTKVTIRNLRGHVVPPTSAVYDVATRRMVQAAQPETFIPDPNGPDVRDMDSVDYVNTRKQQSRTYMQRKYEFSSMMENAAAQSAAGAAAAAGGGPQGPPGGAARPQGVP